MWTASEEQKTTNALKGLNGLAWPYIVLLITRTRAVTRTRSAMCEMRNTNKSASVPFGPLLEKIVCSIWATARKDRVFEVGECFESGNVEMGWARGQAHIHAYAHLFYGLVESVL